MKKPFFENIFVVLVYRNTDDIIDFIKSASAKVENYKIIVVNSYFDDKSRDIFETIAKEYSCDFINVENKGYGYGNNVGIAHAMKEYGFDYLIVSNPDIEIKEFSTELLSKSNTQGLIGPLITARKGKAQNPYWAIRNPFCEWLIYQGYKRKNRVYILAGTAFNRFIRETFLLFFFYVARKRYTPVFAVHGSFVIFPRPLLTKIGMPYDENIFLFGEEADIAYDLHKRKIKSYITKDISVLHKEDGSMSVAKIDERSELRKSYIYLYEKRGE